MGAGLLLTVSVAAGFGTATADRGGPIRFGVADERGKYAPDGGAAFLSVLRDLGMSDNRVSIRWDPSQPDTIPEKAFLDRFLPVAAARGIRVIFQIYPATARAMTSSPDAGLRFARFLQLVARTYAPSIVIVGNEPNQPRFWQPQFDTAGAPVAGAAYEAFLAQAYDALKAVDAAIVVAAGGPSSRGNDDPNAPSNASTSPVRFIHDVGVAYRQSGRTRPIMDQLAFHPYPQANSDPATKSYQWPHAGVADLARLKQAIWDAFHGTAQPTFAETGDSASDDALSLMIDEIGWEVGIPPASSAAYSGSEIVATIDDAAQAQTYADLVRLVTCDPAMTELLLLQLVDERDLQLFQSGLIRADGTVRPSYGAMKRAIAETGGNCVGQLAAWRHTTDVTGASADFGALGPAGAMRTYWSLVARAEEDTSYRAGVFRIPADASLSAAALDRALAGEGAITPTLLTTGRAQAYIGRLVRFPARTLEPGRYLYAVRLSAAMNPDRTRTLVSEPFTVIGAATTSSGNPSGSANGTVVVNGSAYRSGPILYGSHIEIATGTLKLTTRVGSLEVSGRGVPTAFQLLKSSANGKPLDVLKLVGGDFSSCSRSARAVSGLAKKKKPQKTVRRLWAHGKGRFRTRGKHSYTTVRGTYWLTADRCDGTLTQVVQGRVEVFDLVRKVRVVVSAGHTYLAGSR